MYASLPDDHRGWGAIETVVLEVDKPRRVVKSWNWVLPFDTGGTARTGGPRLLQHDAVITLTFIKISGRGEEPRTLIRVHHAGIPVEWVEDLHALWAWHIALFVTD